jgi:hypothetical protein
MTAKANSQNMLNGAAVRREVEGIVAELGRNGVITRIGADVLAEGNRRMRRWLVALVERHPSAYRTLHVD